MAVTAKKISVVARAPPLWQTRGMSSKADSWNQRYAEGKTGWDLGEAPPVVSREAARITEPSKILVPGAGRGHDAAAWAREGHHVTAVDFAPLAVEEGRALARTLGVTMEFLCADVLALPAALGRVDIVWEQTCLCAIQPEERRVYLREMHRVLAPRGQLLALLWNHGGEGGPPYDMPRATVEALMDGLFALESVEEVPDSPEQRRPEFLYRFRRA